MKGLTEALARYGHAFLHAAQTRALLEPVGGLAGWPEFAASWDDMPLDIFMADGGRYRRRRHAVLGVARGGGIDRQPHQAHYQSRDYNNLNGGIARWFEPIAADAGDSVVLRTILQFCEQVFGGLAPQVAHWRVEAHQFRIEAREGKQGLPTPEGIHRDGVDYVLVLLVRRHNIASGVTTIHAADGSDLGSFTLTEALDATLIDDARVFHGVTPVRPINPAAPAYRDVLVLTFRRDG